MFEKEIYIAISEKTGRYKLTDQNHVSVFESKSEADKYAENGEGVIIEGPKHLDKDSVFLISRKAGAVAVDYYGEKKDEIKIPEIKKEYLNPEINSSLAHLKETGDPKYLKRFIKCRFIVPCRVDGQSGIMYGAAKARDITYTLAFTDLEEFYAWGSGTEWEPLEVGFSGLIRVTDMRPIIINVKGNRYVLTEEKINIMFQAVKEVEERGTGNNADKNKKRKDSHV